MGLLGEIFGAFAGGDDSGCTWTCDYCGANLNSQPGFTTSSGTWDCTECGEENDVSEDNIVPDDYVGVWNEHELDDGTIETTRFTKTREVHEFVDSSGEKTTIWKRR